MFFGIRYLLPGKNSIYRSIGKDILVANGQITQEKTKTNPNVSIDVQGSECKFNLTCFLIPDMEWHSWCSDNTFNQALTQGDPTPTALI